jgi:hypothetical protein
MLKAVTEFMMAWAEWLIGLIPFALIALLLWIRLQAAGASPHLAVRIILGLFAWVGLAILGLVMASVGWRTGKAWSLAAGDTYHGRMFADFKAEVTATLGRVPASAN